MQRAVSFHEQGKTEQSRRAAHWANLGLSGKIDIKGTGPLDAKAVQLLRARSKELGEYHRLMTRALDLHDQGDIHEAHRISSEAASRFPDQQPATWFAEQTKDGQQIPPGGWIEFVNRSDYVAVSVDLHYAGSNSVFGFSHTHHIVRDLKAGETQRVYTEDLPKGPTKRLYVEFEMDVDGEPFTSMTSARVVSLNEFGFVPTVIIEKHGAVSFSASQSARSAERAKTRPPPTIEEKIEWFQKQYSSRGNGE
ncbi:MAG: hypothetical protein R6U98_11715 [Pirellulaceae bacterium]